MDKGFRARVALSELEAMGLTLEDLLAASGRDVPAQETGPTVAEYVPVVAAGYQPRTRRTYNSYWTLTTELLGDKALELVTVEDLLSVADEAARRARLRRVGSDGRASRESCVAAMRAVFTRAVKAGLVRSNPALLVDKPRRPSDRPSCGHKTRRSGSIVTTASTSHGVKPSAGSTATGAGATAGAWAASPGAARRTYAGANGASIPRTSVSSLTVATHKVAWSCPVRSTVVVSGGGRSSRSTLDHPPLIGRAVTHPSAGVP